MAPPITRSRLPSVLLCLVGLIVIGWAIHAAIPLQPGVQYSVEKVSTETLSKTVTPNEEFIKEYRVPGEPPSYEFRNLSEKSQRIFLQALESPDNTVTVRTTPPPDLQAASESPAKTLIEYEDEFYVVAGSEPALAGIGSYLVVGLSLIIGLPLLGVGIWSFRTERHQLPLTLLVGIVIFFATSEWVDNVQFWGMIFWTVTGMAMTWVLLSILQQPEADPSRE